MNSYRSKDFNHHSPVGLFPPVLSQHVKEMFSKSRKSGPGLMVNSAGLMGSFISEIAHDFLYILTT